MSRASSPWEFIITVFSVILLMFKSFIGGALILVVAMMDNCGLVSSYRKKRKSKKAAMWGKLEVGQLFVIELVATLCVVFN